MNQARCSSTLIFFRNQLLALLIFLSCWFQFLCLLSTLFLLLGIAPLSEVGKKYEYWENQKAVIKVNMKFLWWPDLKDFNLLPGSHPFPPKAMGFWGEISNMSRLTGLADFPHLAQPSLTRAVSSGPFPYNHPGLLPFIQ